LLVQRPPSGVQPVWTGTHAQVEKSNASPLSHEVETHAPPQKTKPASHWQVPFTQVVFSGHTFPQKPQFSSELVTHTPSQRNDPVGHWQEAPAPLFTHT
jgi:hypothetical protein